MYEYQWGEREGASPSHTLIHLHVQSNLLNIGAGPEPNPEPSGVCNNEGVDSRGMDDREQGLART